MNLWLILAIGGLTYLSRALTLTFMAPPSQQIQAYLDRIPAALFAGLAALALLDSQGGLASGTIVAAIAGALCTVWFRSLPITLLGGLISYFIAVWLGF